MLDDVTHGRIETTRRIHFQYDQGRTLCMGILDTTSDIIGRCRTNGTIDRQQHRDTVIGQRKPDRCEHHDNEQGHPRQAMQILIQECHGFLTLADDG